MENDVDVRLLQAQHNLDHTRNWLLDGMVKLVGRGETTTELVTMAEDVERSSHLFAEESAKYAPKTCRQRCVGCLFWIFPCIMYFRRPLIRRTRQPDPPREPPPVPILPVPH